MLGNVWSKECRSDIENIYVQRILNAINWPKAFEFQYLNQSKYYSLLDVFDVFWVIFTWQKWVGIFLVLIERKFSNDSEHTTSATSSMTSNEFVAAKFWFCLEPVRFFLSKIGGKKWPSDSNGFVIGIQLYGATVFNRLQIESIEPNVLKN